MGKIPVTAPDNISSSTLPESPSPTWLLIKRVWREHVLPHKSRVFIAIFFMLIVALTSASQPMVLSFAVRELMVLQHTDMRLTVAAVIISIGLTKATATYVQAMIMSRLGQNMVANLQVSLFRKLVHADLGRLQQTHSGSFVSNFLYDANLVAASISSGITGIAIQGVTVIGFIATMFYIDWKLAIIGTVVVPVVADFARKLGKTMRKATSGGMSETDNLSRLVIETLKGARTIKAFQREDAEIARAARTINKRLTHLMQGLRARIAAAPVTEAITIFGLAGVLVYASIQNLDPADLMGFITAMFLSYQPLKVLSNLSVVVSEGSTAANRIFGVMDVEPQITDAPDAKALKFNRGAIRLDKVIFHYTKDIATLDGLNLDIPAGQTVALVGPSGAGKSTVFNLIPRFYDVTGGKVTIDGQDVRSVTLASLRKVISIVTQEPFLFDDTVRANIAYGKPDAEQADIEKVARDAAAAEFIAALPQGYDTPVGEQGVKLSGGQRQRIAIARAMLANAPILLLDEATSALDSESERQVQEALARLMKGRTTLVIAHRLSTIKDADRIYVLDHGRVAETGTHDELLAQKSLYSQLYRTELTSRSHVTDKAAPLSVAGE